MTGTGRIDDERPDAGDSGAEICGRGDRVSHRSDHYWRRDDADGRGRVAWLSRGRGRVGRDQREPVRPAPREAAGGRRGGTGNARGEMSRDAGDRQDHGRRRGPGGEPNGAAKGRCARGALGGTLSA